MRDWDSPTRVPLPTPMKSLKRKAAAMAENKRKSAELQAWAAANKKKKNRRARTPNPQLFTHRTRGKPGRIYRDAHYAAQLTSRCCQQAGAHGDGCRKRKVGGIVCETADIRSAAWKNPNR